MRNLSAIRKIHSAVAMAWIGIAAVTLITVAGTSVTPRVVWADPLEQPGLSVPVCQSDGIAMFWHTKNIGMAEAPDGWKIERRHRDSGDWEVETFMFIGRHADALQTFNEQYWDWVDVSAAMDVAYTYRVKAVNADGTDVEGRVWSRRAPVDCQAKGPEDCGG